MKARVMNVNAGCSIFLVTFLRPDTTTVPLDALSLKVFTVFLFRGFFDSTTIGRPGANTSLSTSSLPNHVNLNLFDPSSAPSFFETIPSTLGDLERPVPWHFSHPRPL